MNRHSRTNILIVFADDQRFDTIAALGNPEIRTPNLDRLVAAGTAFTHAHIPGGTSGAVCMPSRAMLHTGRGLFEIEGEGQGIATGHVMLGEHFRTAGYETFGTGKWHNGTRSYARSFSSGAEIFFGGMNDHWNVPACDFDPTGEYPETPWIRDWWATCDVEMRPRPHFTPGKHSTDLFVDAALDFLRDRSVSAKPWLAYVSLMAPHDPRTMPREYLEMYDPATIRLPENFAPEHAIDTGALRVRDELLEAFPRSEEAIRRHIAEYYAMITHLDAGLGRLLDQLEESGERENTIVVFAGDNGLAVGQHGLMGKQSLYDHSVRVPLIFAGPGVAAGEQRDEFCILADIYPSLCDLCGLERPASVTRRSLFSGRDADTAPDALYLAYCDSIRGVRTRTHKLIEYAAEGAERATQLFNLEDDPGETRNLAEDPAMAGELAELRTRLRAMRDAESDRGRPMSEAFWARVEE